MAGIVQLFKRLDPHRLVDTGSGDPSGNNPMGGATTPDQSWAFNNSGDVTDVHTYPGPDWLVAPVYTQGAKERSVYLPAGAKWE